MLYYPITQLLYYYITILLYYSIILLLYYCITLLLYYFIILLTDGCTLADKLGHDGHSIKDVPTSEAPATRSCPQLAVAACSCASTCWQPAEGGWPHISARPLATWLPGSDCARAQDTTATPDLPEVVAQRPCRTTVALLCGGQLGRMGPRSAGLSAVM